MDVCYFFLFFLMKMKMRFDVVPSLVVRRRRPVVTSGGSGGVSRSSGGCDGWRWPKERERTLKRWMTLLLLTCI
jgi:hypothetical protein